MAKDNPSKRAYDLGDMNGAIRQMIADVEQLQASVATSPYSDLGNASDASGQFMLDPVDQTVRINLDTNAQIQMSAVPAADAHVAVKVIYRMGDTTGNSGSPWYLSLNMQNISFPNHDNYNYTADMHQNEYGVLMLEWVVDRWLSYPLTTLNEID